jgi:hypothetical protein
MELKMEKDVFDYIDEETVPKSRNRSGCIWNLLTLLVLLSTVCASIFFVTVFLNPNLDINPFPPRPTLVRLELDTPTPTPREVLPPTWTPTKEIIPTETMTPVPSITSQPTEEIQEEMEEQPTIEISGDMPVILHEGSPQYIPASGWHPDQGCNWMGVAGQVIDINGAPVQGLIIEVGGTLMGKNIGSPTILQATGLATAYGDAGYEVKLSDEPIASSNTLWIQVLDQAGLPLSEQIRFSTYDDCDKNLIIIYFKQIQ